MFKRLIHKILTRKIAGVSLHFTAVGVEMNAIICERKKDQFLIKSQHTGILDFGELKKIINNTIAVACVITGKGIIHHQLQNPFIDWSSSIRERLPDANYQLFVGQIDQNTQFLSIARLDLLERVVKDFQNNDIYPLSIDLGVLSSEPLLQIIDEININLPPYSIKQNNGVIQSLTKQEAGIEYYNIADQNVNVNLLLPLAAALGQIIEFPRQVTSQLAKVETASISNVKYKLFTQLIGQIGLGIILLGLIINIFYFGSISKKLDQVEGQLFYSQTLISQVDSLENQLDEKQKAVDEIGPNKNSKLSYYADKIGNSMIEGIKLTQLNIFPLLKTSQPNKTNKQFDSRKIILKGNNKTNQQLNNWISKLEQLPWIKEVLLLPYKNTNRVSEFEMVVFIR